MQKKPLLVVAVLAGLVAPLAQAGIVRHIVRPAAKNGAHVVVKTARVGAKIAKTVVY